MLDYFDLAKTLARREGERVMTKANEPAYPLAEWLGYRQNQAWGFTKREAYALAAMKGMITGLWTTNDKYFPEAIAERAFEMADCMLAESEKPHD